MEPITPVNTSTNNTVNPAPISQPKKPFNTKSVAMIIGAAILVGGGVFAAMYPWGASRMVDNFVVSPMPAQTLTQTPTPSTSTATKRIVSIKGYFFRKSTTDWGETPTTCDTLIVTGITGGDKGLIDEFIQIVNNHNSINALDEKSGDLILNLNLNELSQTEKRKIILSTPQNTAELKVIDTRGDGMGAPACYSFVKILKVY